MNIEQPLSCHQSIQLWREGWPSKEKGRISCTDKINYILFMGSLWEAYCSPIVYPNLPFCTTLMLRPVSPFNKITTTTLKAKKINIVCLVSILHPKIFYTIYQKIHIILHHTENLMCSPCTKYTQGQLDDLLHNFDD